MISKLSPGLLGVFMQQMRLKVMRRLPITFGWLTKRGDAATVRWMMPLLEQPEIRRDAVRVLRSAFEYVGDGEHASPGREHAKTSQVSR